MPDPQDRRDALAGRALAGLFWLTLALAIGAIVYCAMQGMAQ